MATVTPGRAGVGVPVPAAPRTGGALVEVRDLSWRPSGRRDPVLPGLSLQVRPGERVLLAGPSGCGKSTLLRALAGVLSSTASGDLAGSVEVDGAAPAGSPVGLLVQDPADAVVAGTVGRDVAFGPENLGMPRDQIWSRVRSALASVGFPYGADHPTGALSGGEAQRLALAGVLALSPRLLLLDEPTSMLDPESASVVRQAIVSAVRSSGATMILVEHQLAQWVDHVDRVVVLDPTGRIRSDGPASTLARSADSLAAQGVWVPGRAAPPPLDVPRQLLAPGCGAASEVSADAVDVVRRVRPGLRAQRSTAPVRALSGVSAAVRAGEVVAVVGPSGAGKSTLTALVAGVDRPTAGQVRACGPVADGVSPRPGSWASVDLARRVGWVPQQAELAVVSRTVHEDVLSTSRVLGLDDGAARARAEALLDVLGLAALADADPHHLSGGEQRRLALAGAVAHGPPVLVLDEPTVGQDRLTWAAVAGVILAARDAGVAVVVATHDPELVALADRRITLRAGRVVDDSDDTCLLDGAPDGAARAAGADDLAHPADRARGRDDAERDRLPRRWSRGLAGRSGPLSLLLVSFLLILAAPFVRDVPTALAGIGGELLLLPVALGRSASSWPPVRRMVPGLLAVASVGFSNWLLSPGHQASAGAVAGLRVAFFVLPGVLLTSYVDPFSLGDHLGQRLRLPARPVVAALTALQRFESLSEQWEQLSRTRRVRGLAAGRSPAARGRELAALTFGLLVQSLRQAGRMAVAMEARGFSLPGRVGHRSWAEPAPWLTADWLMAALGLAMAAIPLLWSLLT